jgi:hypothetical protein
LTTFSLTKMGKRNIHIKWSVIRNITLLNITLIPRTSTSRFKLEICWNSSILIDNTYGGVGGQVFEQSVGISMGTNCAPLLADLFLYSYEAGFIQKLPHEKKKNIYCCDL